MSKEVGIPGDPPLPCPEPTLEFRGPPEEVVRAVDAALTVSEKDEVILRDRFQRALGPRGFVHWMDSGRSSMALLAALPVLPLAWFGIGIWVAPTMIRKLREEEDSSVEKLIVAIWAGVMVASSFAWLIFLPSMHAWLVCMGLAAPPALIALICHVLYEAFEPEPDPLPISEFLRVGLQRHFLHTLKITLLQEAEPLDPEGEVRAKVVAVPYDTGPAWRADLEFDLPLKRGETLHVEYRTWMQGGGTVVVRLGEQTIEEMIVQEKKLQPAPSWDLLPEALEGQRLGAGDVWTYVARLAVQEMRGED